LGLSGAKRARREDNFPPPPLPQTPPPLPSLLFFLDEVIARPLGASESFVRGRNAKKAFALPETTGAVPT